MIQINDHCEAFDAAWALWYWLSHNYEGQTCPKYAAFSKFTKYRLSNVPDIDFENNDCDEYENAVEMYHQINEDNWEANFNNFCDYMENKWDDDD